ncbi:MAG: putative LPS assembly protein LptD [Candidatus Kapaibacterium sp.]
MTLVNKYDLWVVGVTSVLFWTGPLLAQTIAPSVDTTASKLKQIRPGLELPDSLYIARDTVKGDIDTIVRYTANDSTVFSIPEKKMTLVGKAIVEFQDRELDAHTIVMDFQHNLMHAYSRNIDSVLNSEVTFHRVMTRDTNRAKNRGAPKLTEGGTVYEGEIIVYNFKTKQGTTQLGTTEMQGGFYYGEKIKQVAPKTLFVQNGRYTTCDEPHPHYYFASPEMKVNMGGQIFAAPVYLYVADVPIFMLPFGMFPDHESGRHSGLIPPSYQTQGGRGYGLTHLGYYEVWSDYADSRIQSDIYTVGGYNIDFQSEWMKRYLLNSAASIEVGYGKTRFSSGDPFQKDWLVNAQLPNLQLGYQTALSANLSFQSDGYFQSIARNFAQYLTQQVTSNAAFSTSWPDAGVSLGINYSRSQSLLDGTYQESSPQLNLSKTTWFPFQSADGSPVNPTLASLGIGYNFSASHNLSRSTSTPGVTTDTSLYTTSESYSMLHSPSISISPKLGYFTISPYFSMSDAWLVREHTLSNPRKVIIHNDTTSDTVAEYDTTTEHRFMNLFNYNTGVNISTTLYGIANIGAFGIEAIRHTIQPTIGLSYLPDLSTQNYKPILNPLTGQYDYYNIFNGEPNGTIVGQGKSATMTMGLSNNFEAKVDRQVTKDSTAVDHVKLFAINAGTGYNLVTKLLSPLSLNASSSIGTLFSLSGNASFSFYPANYVGGDSTQYSLASLHQFFIRPTSASASLNGSFSAPTTLNGENYDSVRRLFNITSPEDERALFFGGYYPGEYIDIPFRPKWNINYGLSYQQSFSQTGATVRDFGATLALTLPLTVNWSFTTSASYDLLNKQIIIPELDVTRDLHCWVMHFSYRPPNSAVSGFNLTIQIKAPQLQDIKLTRTENNYGEF